MTSAPTSDTSNRETATRLVLQNSWLSEQQGVAIVLPLTTREPAQPYPWQVQLESGDSWALVRQPRTVRTSRLNRQLTPATAADLVKIRNELAQLLLGSSQRRHGLIYRDGNEQEIYPGTVWSAAVPGLSAGSYEGQVLVLDYNYANQMAIVIVVDDSETRRPSALAAVSASSAAPGKRWRWCIKCGPFQCRTGLADLEGL